jgi:hypothetical protein
MAGGARGRRLEARGAGRRAAQGTPVRGFRSSGRTRKHGGEARPKFHLAVGQRPWQVGGRARRPMAGGPAVRLAAGWWLAVGGGVTSSVAVELEMHGWEEEDKEGEKNKISRSHQRDTRVF